MFHTKIKRKLQLELYEEIKQKTQNNFNDILKMLDKALFHLKIVIEYNFLLQNLLINLINSKKLITSFQIKFIYKALTENRANQSVFQYQKKILKSYDFCQNQSVFRIYQRLIQKMITKISHYHCYETQLSFLHRNMVELLKFGEIISKKGRKLVDLDYFLKTLGILFIENRKIQDKIFEILMNRGYITSIDDFYTINGYQCQNSDFIEGAIKQQDEQDVEDFQIKYEHKKSRELKNSQELKINIPLKVSAVNSNQVPIKKEKQKYPKENQPQVKKNYLHIKQQQTPAPPIQKYIASFIQKVVQNNILNTLEEKMEEKQPQVQKKINQTFQIRCSQIVIPNFTMVKRNRRIKSLMQMVKRFQGQNPKISCKLLQLIDNSNSIRKGEVLHKRIKKQSQNNGKSNFSNFRSSIKKRLFESFTNKYGQQNNTDDLFNSIYDWAYTSSDIRSSESKRDIDSRNNLNMEKIKSIQRGKNNKSENLFGRFIKNEFQSDILHKSNSLKSSKLNEANSKKKVTYNNVHDKMSNHQFYQGIKEVFMIQNNSDNIFITNQQEDSKKIAHVINVKFNQIQNNKFHRMTALNSNKSESTQQQSNNFKTLLKKTRKSYSKTCQQINFSKKKCLQSFESYKTYCVYDTRRKVFIQ